MKSPLSLCPVPEEQRPVNEYRLLAESWFFRWGTFSGWDYFKPVVILWLISCLVSAPVSAASLKPNQHPIEFAYFAAFGACIIPALAVVRLYLGWNYVYQRLVDLRVFYEESGWYDGQIWEKNPEMLDQDRLIANYEVRPVLRKIQNTLLGIVMTCALLLGSGILWNRFQLWTWL
jgi:Conserved in the green lineage and diatoms 27